MATAETESHPILLFQLFAVAVRWWRWLLLGMVLGGIGGFVAADLANESQYESQALLVADLQSEGNTLPIEYFRGLAVAPDLLDRVRQEIPATRSVPLEDLRRACQAIVSTRPGHDQVPIPVVDLRVKWPDAEVSRQIASAWAQQVLSRVRDLQLTSLKEVKTSLDGQFADAKKTLEAFTPQQADLQRKRQDEIRRLTETRDTDLATQQAADQRQVDALDYQHSQASNVLQSEQMVALIALRKRHFDQVAAQELAFLEETQTHQRARELALATLKRNHLKSRREMEVAAGVAIREHQRDAVQRSYLEAYDQHLELNQKRQRMQFLVDSALDVLKGVADDHVRQVFGTELAARREAVAIRIQQIEQLLAEIPERRQLRSTIPEWALWLRPSTSSPNDPNGTATDAEPLTLDREEFNPLYVSFRTELERLRNRHALLEACDKAFAHAFDQLGTTASPADRQKAVQQYLLGLALLREVDELPSASPIAQEQTDQLARQIDVLEQQIEQQNRRYEQLANQSLEAALRVAENDDQLATALLQANQEWEQKQVQIEEQHRVAKLILEQQLEQAEHELIAAHELQSRQLLNTQKIALEVLRRSLEIKRQMIQMTADQNIDSVRAQMNDELAAMTAYRDLARADLTDVATQLGAVKQHITNTVSQLRLASPPVRAEEPQPRYRSLIAIASAIALGLILGMAFLIREEWPVIVAYGRRSDAPAPARS